MPRPPFPARLARHWPLAVLLCVGLLPRAGAWRAVQPAFGFPDTVTYLLIARSGRLSAARPAGYSLLLAVLRPLGDPAVVTAVQHALGLVIVGVIYALVVHRGGPRWLAVLAAVPAALDGYVISLEQFVMAETLFDLLLVCAVAVLLWHPTLSTRRAVVVGLLVGLVGLTRTVGLPLIVLVVGYCLVRRVGWRPVAAVVGACGVLLVGYAGTYQAQHGKFALSGYSGHFLYIRAMDFADCRQLSLTPAERQICPLASPEHRPVPNNLLWHQSPDRTYLLSPKYDSLYGDVARKAIERQPGAYAAAVLEDATHFLRPGHPLERGDNELRTFQFPTPAAARSNDWAGAMATDLDLRPAPTTTRSTALRLMHGYQRYTYLPGPALGVLLLLPLLAAVVVLRRRRRRDGHPRSRDPGTTDTRTSTDAVLVALLAACCLVVPAATELFDYRYGLPATVVAPVGGALALIALRTRTGGTDPGSAPTASTPRRRVSVGTASTATGSAAE